MRSDDDVCVLAAGDGDGDGQWQPAGRAPAIDHLPYSPDVNAVVLEDLDEGFLELSGTDRVEQLEEPCRCAAHVSAAFCDDSEERLATAAGAGDPVEAAMLASVALLLDRMLDV